jgi:23S rRNA (adenine2503-C2)-methyltransferase
VKSSIEIMTKAKPELRSMTLQETIQLTESLGEKKFRGKQVYAWVHRGVKTFEEMTDLSQNFRQNWHNTLFWTI